MSDLAEYDADILLWSERQAALLRDLKARVRSLPNELDLENVAEEIESVGRSELATVKSQLGNLLRHIIKLAAAPHPDPVAHWLEESRAFRNDISERISPAMRSRIDLDRIWARACRDAADNFADFGQRLPALPDRCPFALDELASDAFEPRYAMECLRQAIADEGRDQI